MCHHDVISHDSEPPASLDALVGLVQKTASESFQGWVDTISIRMPMVTACTIRALAEYSGKSRNQLMVKSLEVALDALWQELPECEREHIELIRSRLLEEKIESKAGESEAA